MSVEDEVTKKNFQMYKKKSNVRDLENLKKEIKQFSYEESMDALEIILADVQNENISLDKIQDNYIKGHLLLKHCEELLQFVEQEINEINPNNLDID